MSGVGGMEALGRMPSLEYERKPELKKVEICVGSNQADLLLWPTTLTGSPPMLSNFPRYPLTFGPTPIEHLSRLTKHLGGAVDIYAKREDCNSGLAFGGNKLRKLEYI